MKKNFNCFVHVNKIFKKYDCVLKKNKKIKFDKKFLINDLYLSKIFNINLNNFYSKEKNFLYKIFKEFSKNLEIFLSNMLDYNIKVDVDKIKINTYKKYFRNSSSLISLNCFKINSIKDFGFLIYSHSFILRILEIFFRGKYNFLYENKFNSISYSEIFINNKFKSCVIKKLSKILYKHLFLNIISYRTNKFMYKFNKNFFSLNNFVIIVNFNFCTNEHSNSFSICFPLNFIKYVNKLLIKKINSAKKINSKITFNLFKNIKFVMKSYLKHFYITLLNLYKLKKNDILKIENPKKTFIYIDKKLFFTGENIVFKSKNSILIQKIVYSTFLKHGDNMNNELDKFKKYSSKNNTESKYELDNETFSENLNKDVLNSEDLNKKINYIGDIKIKISVKLGSVKIKTKKLLSIKNGSVIQLNKLAGEPLDVLANNCVIAKGEIVVIKNSYGIRILEILNNLKEIK
ncbi:FliM/FliN family flagellar motor switch protein [Buchnera aphidicola (Ceratoglyphina bambusae)]|uniref:FliM/FliN family flagellar motor switch protein n=1 Tax=Buchnera aphidicola TaxID=9 RepID=UPI0031B801E1